MHNIIDASEVREENNEQKIKLTTFLISKAIERIHYITVNFIFNDVNKFSQMLIVNILSTRKTQYQQLSVIIKDEEIIADTMRVHKKIFLKQLKLFKNDEIFSNRLFLVYENAFITKLIRNVKLKQFDSIKIFQ